MALEKHVMVVEDDRLTREALRVVLEAAGYQVECVPDGQQALDRLRAGERPWLILLDLGLPRMGGRKFRQEQLGDPALASVPVFLVSAEGGLEQTAEDLKAAGHVAKPFDLDDVLAAVWRLDETHAGTGHPLPGPTRADVATPPPQF